MTIRYGIIGTGWITEAFLAGAAGVPGMALRAVCSRSEERGREFAARHGADLVFTDPARMAASPDIDAVYIASPNVLHAAQSRLFLENGKHVLCEKPLAARPEEVESLQALAVSPSGSPNRCSAGYTQYTPKSISAPVSMAGLKILGRAAPSK